MSFLYTADDIVAAFVKIGFKPARWSYINFERNCCCGLGALYLAEHGPDKVPRDDFENKEFLCKEFNLSGEEESLFSVAFMEGLEGKNLEDSCIWPCRRENPLYVAAYGAGKELLERQWYENEDGNGY